MEMIDWWTVPGSLWGVKNVDFKVELHPDVDTQPDRDSNPYSDRELDALDRGAWRFVIVDVTPVSTDLTDRIDARQALSGIEWGDMPDGRIDRSDLLDQPIKGLAGEAVIELLRLGFDLKVEEDSDFAPEKLKAPF